MKYIEVRRYCDHYSITHDFFNQLNDFELIELEDINGSVCFHERYLDQVEQFKRLHFDLNVNFAGLDVINNMKSQIIQLQEKIRILENL